MSPNIAGPRQVGRASLSTRRGFVAAVSLGAVSLYGLWAGVGAAPLRFWDLGGSGIDGMDMSGDGHGGADGLSPEAFRGLADEFNAKHRQADGSVSVQPMPAGQSMPGMSMPAESEGSGQSMPGMKMPDSTNHSGHEMPATSEQASSLSGETSPLDVYLLAQQWSFDPSVLHLSANQSYRFRMMAVDAAHGASLQLGKASHIIRLPKGALVEQELSFTQPGEYLLYCTMYCGEGHQFMSGKIIVS
jgi:cytochrome c oxidase subunit 2